MLSRLFKKGSATHRVKVPALGTELDVPRDATVLEWALSKGVAFPHSCRVGTCGTCKCRLVTGKIYELSDRSYALSGDELAENYILACQSMPRSDLELELPKPPDEIERIPDAAAKWKRSAWSPQGRFTRAIAAYLVFPAIMVVIGGPVGAAAAVTSTVIARLWVEAFNYLQHCGLVRVESEPVAPQHVWNHLSTLTRTAAFEITNHCEHHLDACLPYYRMKPDSVGPRMPSAFARFIIALVPPLWYRYVLWPRLRHWDLHLATPAERELAREANRKAGWPDWLGEEHARGHGSMLGAPR